MTASFQWFLDDNFVLRTAIDLGSRVLVVVLRRIRVPGIDETRADVCKEMKLNILSSDSRENTERPNVAYRNQTLKTDVETSYQFILL